MTRPVENYALLMFGVGGAMAARPEALDFLRGYVPPGTLATPQQARELLRLT